MTKLETLNAISESIGEDSEEGLFAIFCDKDGEHIIANYSYVDIYNALLWAGKSDPALYDIILNVGIALTTETLGHPIEFKTVKYGRKKK